MNVSEYISSGIIEQYVLGDVSSQEKREVECMSHIYPEIKEELEKVQLALEGYALENAIEAPQHLKKNIFDLIQKESPKTAAESATKVVEMKPSYTNDKVKNYNKKYAVAATVAFVVASSIAAYSLISSGKQSAAYTSKIETLNNEKQIAEENYKVQLAQLSLHNNTPFVLHGNEKAPGKTMVVFWNKNTGNVCINNVQLPKAPLNKQYQLWALKDGKPIDLGVFDATGLMQNMKSVEGVQAFAVTLENKGGSPTPHLEELYGLVNVQG